jgi:hypothetical protein
VLRDIFCAYTRNCPVLQTFLIFRHLIVCMIKYNKLIKVNKKDACNSFVVVYCVTKSEQHRGFPRVCADSAYVEPNNNNSVTICQTVHEPHTG